MNLKLKQLKSNSDNPRIIRDPAFKKLVQSLKDFPEMTKVRPIVVNKEYVILGGNMRYLAMKEAGWEEAPVEVVDWSKEKQKEFIIKDNASSGEWNWDALADVWSDLPLDEWGLPLPYLGDIDDPKAEWLGMPEFDQQNLAPVKQLIVSFKSKEDIEEFSRLVNQTITDKTRSIWFPKAEIGHVADKEYADKT